MHDASAIIQPLLDNDLRDKFLNLKGRKRWNLWWHEVLRSTFIPNTRSWNNEVAFFERAMQSPTHAKHQHSFRIHGRQKFDDQRCRRRADREVDNRNSSFLAVYRCKRRAFRLFVAAEIIKTLDVIIEVRQDDLFLEVFQIRSRISLQHIDSDPSLCCVGVDPIVRRIEIRIQSIVGSLNEPRREERFF